MSVEGQTRKSALVTAMSAFPPIATKLRISMEVRFVPNSEVVQFFWWLLRDGFERVLYWLVGQARGSVSGCYLFTNVGRAGRKGLAAVGSAKIRL